MAFSWNADTMASASRHDRQEEDGEFSSSRESFELMKRQDCKLEDFHFLVDAIQSKKGYPLSKEQLDICKFIYNEQEGRNLVIDSVAGSGKTSTLLIILWFVKPDSKVLLLSFNKTVQTTLQEEVSKTTVQVIQTLRRELPNTSIFTCHAHGLSALRRTYRVSEDMMCVNDNKPATVEQAIEKIIGDDYTLRNLMKKWKTYMVQMLKLLMNLAVDCTLETNWSVEFIERASEKYGIPIPVHNEYAITKKSKDENKCCEKYYTVLYEAYQICLLRTNQFDFTDMVYLPIRLNLPLLKYDLVLIDESQDLNAIQMEMIRRSVPTGPTGPGQGTGPQGPTGGRIVFVGDQHQSIYGFRGADTEAIQTISQSFNTAFLPLHTCWRCPKEVINVAQTIVPHIRAREDAPLGQALTYKEKFLLDVLEDYDESLGQLVLCRTNAPLVELALKLYARNIPCFVSANSFRDGLKNNLKQLDCEWMRHKKHATYLDKVDAYQTWKRTVLKEEGQEKIEQTDQLDSLYLIIQSMKNSRATAEDISDKIDSLFSSTVKGSIRLSTIHQCKGQEEDVVYMIRSSLLPHPSCKGSDWQMAQEMNLKYVAITRAKRELYYFVDD